MADVTDKNANDVFVDGSVAHDSPDSDGGGPVKVGNKAIAHGANPTAVAANDRTDWYANRHGVPFILGGHPNIITKEHHFTTANTNFALTTATAGQKIVVTEVEATVGNATTVNVQCRVGFGTTTLAGTSTAGATGIILSHPNIAPGGGMVVGNGAGIVGIGADQEDLRVTSAVPTSGALRIGYKYFIIES